MRHQLFVHPDVPYTSHNSSMSFFIEVFEEGYFKKIVSYTEQFLSKYSADGSDPGLCAVIVEDFQHSELLIDFGQEAKRKVLTKKEAYNLAERLGIHLSEHGGTGDGIIGALAGVGLHLSGNDGRIRGKQLVAEVNKIITVGEIYEKAGVDLVRSLDGVILVNAAKVQLGEKVKSIFREGKSVLLVRPNEDENSRARWQTCSMEYIKSITN